MCEPEKKIDLPYLQREVDRIRAGRVEVRAKMAGYLLELGVEV
ncbi:MAG: hypothetical protein OXI38_00660 [Bacteroidota bacterium]|nr:hypothetical protein [Bacteroidota bacterium]